MGWVAAEHHVEKKTPQGTTSEGKPFEFFHYEMPELILELDCCLIAQFIS